MKVTVYERTTSYCGMCVATKRKLDKEDIAYEAKAIEDQTAEWLHNHKAAGRMQAPIVVVDYPSGGSVEWSGFQPDAINSLKRKAD